MPWIFSRGTRLSFAAAWKRGRIVRAHSCSTRRSCRGSAASAVFLGVRSGAAPEGEGVGEGVTDGAPARAAVFRSPSVYFSANSSCAFCNLLFASSGGVSLSASAGFFGVGRGAALGEGGGV